MQTVLPNLPIQRRVWSHRMISDWDEAMGIKQDDYPPSTPRHSSHRVRSLR